MALALRCNATGLRRLKHPLRTMWHVDQVWTSEVRTLAAAKEARGKRVSRFAFVSEIENFSLPERGN